MKYNDILYIRYNQYLVKARTHLVDFSSANVPSWIRHPLVSLSGPYFRHFVRCKHLHRYN